MIKVFTNGVFDLIHHGHLHILREASKLGDELYIGVNSDYSVKRLKGDKRPIISEKDRIEMLESLRFVDHVILFDDPTPIKLIEYLKPDIIVKGGDYKEEEVVGSHLAKVVIIPLIDDISTTKIVTKIIRDK